MTKFKWCPLAPRARVGGQRFFYSGLNFEPVAQHKANAQIPILLANYQAIL